MNPTETLPPSSSPLENTDDGISVQGRIKLLGMTFDRLVFSVHAIPFVGLPFAIWQYHLGRSTWGMVAWIAVYALAALGMRGLRRAYERDARALVPAAFHAKWCALTQHVGWIHGLGIGCGPLLVLPDSSFELHLLLLVSIAAILAANATHQTPVFSVFQRFLFCCWGLVLLGIPLVFPDHWIYVLPLALLFGLAIYRHAHTAHHFFVQQIALEEKGVRLAENYRQAKNLAERALNDKSRFLATASHDLRQPVHAMGFLVEAISSRNKDATLAPVLRDLKQSVRSVNIMFTSLLDLSRIEGGHVSAKVRAVELQPIFEDVVTIFREEARSRGLDLRERLSERALLARGDATLLRRCLINLAQNGLRYTSQGGVLLSARRRGSDILLEVWDTGVGIADDDKTRIYSPFYRHEHAWSLESAGHGLGLAVVARCAALMGADYGMDSTEGRGSRFWLRMPAVTREVPALNPEKPLESPVHVAMRSLSGRCLIIDDDPLVTSAWHNLFRAWGVTVRSAANGSEAFATLDDGFVPQAVFCDQRLRSGESGFEILEAVLARCPEACGAMVSGEFNSQALQDAEEAGYLVLQKPVPPEQLHALLDQWLTPCSPQGRNEGRWPLESPDNR